MERVLSDCTERRPTPVTLPGCGIWRVAGEGRGWRGCSATVPRGGRRRCHYRCAARFGVVAGGGPGIEERALSDCTERRPTPVPLPGCGICPGCGRGPGMERALSDWRALPPTPAALPGCGYLPWWRERAGDGEGAERLARIAADAGNTSALRDLVRLRRKPGAERTLSDWRALPPTSATPPRCGIWRDGGGSRRWRRCRATGAHRCRRRRRLRVTDHGPVAGGSRGEWSVGRSAAVRAGG